MKTTALQPTKPKDLSVATGASWVGTDALSDHLNADFYAPEYLEIDRVISDARCGFKRLGSLVKKPFKGAFYVLANEYAPKGVPFLRVANITKGYVDLTDCAFLPLHIHAREAKTRVRPGDLLFAKGGSLGNCAVVPEWLTDANISQDLIGAVPRSDLESYYAVAVLTSPRGIRQMIRWMQRATHPHLSNDSICNVKVPWSIAAIRRSIGHKVRAAERLRAAASAKVADATSLIGRVFQGADLSSLKPNPDGSCDYFGSFVQPAELGIFHGAQFFAPKRKRAVELVKSTGISATLGDKGRRLQSKGKLTTTRPHVDPANVTGSDGYWSSGGLNDGSDVVLAKPGQVLFLRMRPYLNKTTINDTDQTVSGSPEFLVYALDGLDAYYATLCLRQPWALILNSEVGARSYPVE